MRAILLCLGLLSLGLVPAPAKADQPRTILVLDASGSMWGQIDGVNKIVIARDVIGSLLDDIPADRALGLTAYGHRRKGDCADIEALVAPDVGTAPAIRDAVNAINPKGKTPLSDAVVAAARSLRHTEEAATVILVSDGRETCDADPCAVGRALEESGIDFTAHVIGFDVANAADRAQLQCLAENTGGRFLTASDAGELAAALTEVAVAPPPDPEPEPEPEPARPETFRVSFSAKLAASSPKIGKDLLWSITAMPDGPAVVERLDEPFFARMLSPGDYRAEVLRLEDEAQAESEFRITSGNRDVVLILPPIPLPEASLDAPPGATVGDTVEIGWRGPDGPGDYIAIAEPGMKPRRHLTYSYTRNGDPASLRLPPDPGEYELRYVHVERSAVLARQPFSVSAAQATLDAPETVQLGETLEVEWQGPDAPGDYIAIAEPDAPGGKYDSYRYTRSGSPAAIQAPAQPGSYELRYVLQQGRRVLARRAITVEEAAYAVSGPAEAELGTSIEVDWTGPDAAGDYVAIAEPGAPGGKYETYGYTRKGSPLTLQMPSEPGDYELRYVLRQDRKILARQPLSAVAGDYAISGPETALIGTSVSVDWSGPDAAGDYISVARPDDKSSKYVNYTHTRKGSPLTLTMPPHAGEYELRYVLRKDARVLARQPIRIEAGIYTVSGPESAAPGATISVEWQGPDASGDYISVASPEQPGGKYAAYAYTRNGSPAKLTLPEDAGTYELRYVLRQGASILARQSILVE